MRHIPEEELHAYLDQALSRSQCVEIERHLAACPPCRAQRDGIAALRDRTTAMLAVLSPAAVFPPSFDLIHQRSIDRAAAHRRLVRLAVWAASLIAAVAFGWWGRNLLGQRPTASGAVPGQFPSLVVSGTDSNMVPREPDAEPAGNRVRVRSPGGSRDRLALSVGHDSSTPPPRAGSNPTDSGAHPPLDDGQDGLNTAQLTGDRELVDLAPASMWRLVSQADAEEESGAPLATIPGLPVVQVKIQGVQPNQKIVAVDQELPDGQMIRTIEGPAAQMSNMLAQDGQRGSAAGVLSTEASRALEALMTMRLGDRMVVLRGPADSLRALMSRVFLPREKP